MFREGILFGQCLNSSPSQSPQVPLFLGLGRNMGGRSRSQSESLTPDCPWEVLELLEPWVFEWVSKANGSILAMEASLAVYVRDGVIGSRDGVTGVWDGDGTRSLLQGDAGKMVVVQVSEVRLNAEQASTLDLISRPSRPLEHGSIPSIVPSLLVFKSLRRNSAAGPPMFSPVPCSSSTVCFAEMDTLCATSLFFFFGGSRGASRW